MLNVSLLASRSHFGWAGAVLQGRKICLTFTKATSVLYCCVATKEEMKKIVKETRVIRRISEELKAERWPYKHTHQSPTYCLACLRWLAGGELKSLMGTEKSPTCIGHVFCCYVNPGQSQERCLIKALPITSIIQWEASWQETPPSLVDWHAI